MPEWIEPIDKGQAAKSAKQLPVIKLRWETTTVPEKPVRLPIPALLSINSQEILVHAERQEDPEYGEEAEEIDLHFLKQDIVSVEVFLMPELDWDRFSNGPPLTDRSRAIIRHRDPFEVVPYFESIFTSDDDYWLRALAKTVKERLKVKKVNLFDANQSDD